MKKFTTPTAIALCACLICGASQGSLVAVDAGHTLRSPGASAAVDGRPELLFNRELSLVVAQRLRSRSIQVTMANEPARASEDFKARAGAGAGTDLFLSIHHDSAKPALLVEVPGSHPPRWEDAQGRFSGFALFVDPCDAKGVACARHVGRALEMAGEHPSLYHASADLGESRRLLDPQYGVHAFPELALARLRRAPMVLLEAGVIVNPAESLSLRDPAAVGRIADAVADGVFECLAAR